MPYDGVFISPAVSLNSEHEAIIQVLDRVNNGWLMKTESFQETEDKWNSTDVFYSPEGKHPDPFLYEKDPQAALQASGARKAKVRLSDTRVVTEGQPRLVTKLIVEDEEIAPLMDKNEIFLSTGWFSLAKRDPYQPWIKHTSGKVRPQHLLLFPKTSGVKPGDGGAFVLNTGQVIRLSDENPMVKFVSAAKALFGVTNTDDPLTKELLDYQAKAEEFVTTITQKDEQIAALNTSALAKDEEIKKLAEVSQNSLKEIETLKVEAATNVEKIAALEQAISQKEEWAREQIDGLQRTTAELEALKIGKAEMETQIATFTQEKKDLEWAEFKLHLPPGFVHGDDKENEARAKFEAGDTKFHLEIQEFKDKQASTNVEGEESAPAPPVVPTDKARLTIGVLNLETGRLSD